MTSILPQIKLLISRRWRDSSSHHLGIENEELVEIVQKQCFKSYEEILIADNIEYESMLKISEYLDNFPELKLPHWFSTREYLYPNHFSGYVGRINEEEI